MPTQVLVAIGAASIALPLLAWALFSRPSRAQQAAVSNLQRGLRSGSVGPTNATLVRQPRRSLALRLIPAKAVARVDRLAARAGRPAAWPMERLLSAKLVLPVVAAILGMLYITTKGSLLGVVSVGGARGRRVLPAGVAALQRSDEAQ